jgi:formylglycine-generating enzyme required for sulfatase activity
MRIPTLFALFVLLPFCCLAQVIEGVYLKESSVKRSVAYSPDPENPVFLIPELRHSDSLALSIMKYYEANYSKSPLELKGCTYFYPNQTGNLYRIKGQQKESNLPASKGHQNLNELNETFPSYFPSSFRFYADTLLHESPEYETGQVRDLFFFKFLCKKTLSEIYRPFYFKNTEVSNGEYKEFTDWVRDSIARTILLTCGYKDFGIYTDRANERVLLNWKTKLDWADSAYKECLSSLYKPQAERFYNRKEIDARKLNYAYHPFAYEKRITGDVINVYPDTLAWVNDFSYSFNEPMTNMYFWHIAYAGYPVVGISRNQAEAFLHWKTEREQKELDKQYKGLKIEYDLPAEYQWEMVATSQKGKDGPTVFNKGFGVFSDKNFLTDLRLKSPDTITQHLIGKDAVGKDVPVSMLRYQNLLVPELQSSVSAIGDFTIDGIFHTAPVDYDMAVKGLKYRIQGKSEWGRKLTFGPKPDLSTNAIEMFKINHDENDICYMGGNVSEWMKETYKENWAPIYTRRHALMKMLKGKDVEIALALEEYYNSKCDTVNGVLVRGSNWFDERYNNRYGKNTAGMNAKTFVSPDASYSTLGFRYIIRVMRKDEPVQAVKKQLR